MTAHLDRTVESWTQQPLKHLALIQPPHFTDQKTAFANIQRHSETVSSGPRIQSGPPVPGSSLPTWPSARSGGAKRNFFSVCEGMNFRAQISLEIVELSIGGKKGQNIDR